MRKLLEKLPKAELHLHLRGAIPVEVFASLLNKYDVTAILEGNSYRTSGMFERYGNIRPFLSSRNWSVEEVSRLFQYENFDQFLATYHFTSYFIRDTSDLKKLITGVLEDLRAQNVVYAEITISVIEYIQQGIPLPVILTCLEQATDFPGIRVQWIVDLVRNIGHEAALKLLRQIIALDRRSVVGITLGGSEHLFPPAPFENVYAAARDHGLRLTVHAGEALGPESIWDALRVLKVERIGHGVRAIEDPDLVAYLVEHRIPLEICPTSNLCTGVFSSYEAHPLKALFDAGVPIAISTDDPTFFGTALVDEYMHVRDMGVSDSDILEILKNSFRHAFLPDEEIEKYVHRLLTIHTSLAPTVFGSIPVSQAPLSC